MFKSQSFDKLRTSHLKKIKKDFPIFKKKMNGKKLVYLDSTATSQKPRQVIEQLKEYYERYNANIHRAVYAIGERATQEYEDVRIKVADFIVAPSPEEIIFTKGATESINLVAYTWGEANVKRGDNVVTTIMEHHSNFVPWQRLCKKKRAELRVAPVTKNGKIDLKKFYSLVNKRTKLVAVTHASNMLGTINPVADITKKVKTKNRNTKVLIDGVQAVPHMPVNIQKIGCDFYAFSGHKMLGPTGVGVLWARKEILEEMPPFLTGGHMISEVTVERSTWNEVPHKFEAGTQNIAQVIGLGAAIDYLQKIGTRNIYRREDQLTRYALVAFKKVKGIEIYGPKSARDRVGTISFNIKGVHSHDVAQIVAEEGICIRAGHHCTMPLHLYLEIDASARASFYIYNTKNDIDKLVKALLKAKKILA